MIVLASGLYWVSIGLVCLAGSALIAHVLRRRGRQERGVWAAGLLGALVLPLMIPLVSGVSSSSRTTAGMSGPSGVIELAPIQVGVAGAPLFEWLGPVLLWVWGGLSLVLLVRLMAAIRTIGRLQAGATATRVAGGIVKVTESRGPAVVGFLRPVVLVPRWVLDLPAERRGWILRHEKEHIRGRDPWLLAFVLAARIVVPWNPVVWWFGTTIRSAIETDCDRRTVGRRGDVRSYGEALLAVAGGRRGRDPLPAMAPAFAERSVPLADRIQVITTPRSPLGGPVRIALAAVAILTVAAACEMPAPTETETTVERTIVPPATEVRDLPVDDPEPATSGPDSVEVTEPATPATVGSDAVEADETSTDAAATGGQDSQPPAPPGPGESAPPSAGLGGDTVPVLGPAPRPAELGTADTVKPRFFPYDSPPRLVNNQEVRRVLTDAYPPLLKESGIGGEVVVWLWISEEGEVLDTQVRDDPPGTSGYYALDVAALDVADSMRFEPAMNGDEPTAVWVQIPITFTVAN